jgi:hypothetical protein
MDGASSGSPLAEELAYVRTVNAPVVVGVGGTPTLDDHEDHLVIMFPGLVRL